MTTRLSLAYLALPALPFLVAWMRPGAAVVAGGGLALAGWLALRHDSHGGSHRRSPIGLDVVLVVAIVLVLAMICGAGGVGFQRLDWFKHNAILDDLTTQPWPVVYDEVAGVSPAMLSYGIGYYLPAAALGKLVGGVPVAHLGLLAWTLAGLGLVAAWVARLSRRGPLLALCAWLGFSGMDVLGLALLGGRSQDAMQWWSGFAQYSSNPTLLFWTPQHALAGWLGAALVLAAEEPRRPPAELVAIVVLVALWSPFVALGLVPLAAVVALRRPFKVGPLAAAVAAMLPFGVILAAYLVAGGRPEVPSGWVWSAFGLVRGLGLWALFVAVEVAVPIAVTGWWWWRRPGPAPERRWWIAVAATLVLLPAGYVGMYNDLVMRASIPALFVLGIMVLRLPWGRGFAAAAPRATRVLALALVVGAIQPAADLANQVMWSRGEDPPNLPPIDLTLTDLPGVIPLQYVTPLRGPYVRWLAPASLRARRVTAHAAPADPPPGRD